MLFVISPAKSLDFNVKNLPAVFSEPIFLKESQFLVEKLREFSTKDLGKLMSISDKLADLNFQRFRDFSTPFHQNNSKPALFVFDGDVYGAIDESNYDEADLNFAQNNLRILSGLYGVLKPLDLIQPYRLEMSTNLTNARSKNLYQFWQNNIANHFNEELKGKGTNILINLASSEYSQVIDEKLLNGKLLNIIFKNNKDGSYKNIGLFSKKARGLMANFIIKNKLTKTADLKSFNEGGYSFRKEFSDEFNWHFYA